jgi:hypothetical protein
VSDFDYIKGLIAIASSNQMLSGAQSTAAQRLLAFDGEIYPADGCAITLSVLLQLAGVDVPNTFRAFDLVGVLQGRGWSRVTVGEQQQGDVGTTCGPEPQHGVDHIYLVLRIVNQDEMVIADNQASTPHFRYASGLGGKSPTTFFLRANAP